MKSVRPPNKGFPLQSFLLLEYLPLGLPPELALVKIASTRLVWYATFRLLARNGQRGQLGDVYSSRHPKDSHNSNLSPFLAYVNYPHKHLK